MDVKSDNDICFQHLRRKDQGRLRDAPPVGGIDLTTTVGLWRPCSDGNMHADPSAVRDHAWTVPNHPEGLDSARSWLILGASGPSGRNALESGPTRRGDPWRN